MQKIVIVANGAAYGSESLLTACASAIALRDKESGLELRLFLMSDAVTAGLKGQKTRRGLQHSTNAGDPDRAKRSGQTVQNLYRRARHYRAAAD